MSSERTRWKWHRFFSFKSSVRGTLKHDRVPFLFCWHTISLELQIVIIFVWFNPRIIRGIIKNYCLIPYCHFLWINFEELVLLLIAAFLNPFRVLTNRIMSSPLDVSTNPKPCSIFKRDIQTYSAHPETEKQQQ